MHPIALGVNYSVKDHESSRLHEPIADSERISFANVVPDRIHRSYSIAFAEHYAELFSKPGAHNNSGSDHQSQPDARANIFDFLFSISDKLCKPDSFSKPSDVGIYVCEPLADSDGKSARVPFCDTNGLCTVNADDVCFSIDLCDPDRQSMGLCKLHANTERVAQVYVQSNSFVWSFGDPHPECDCIIESGPLTNAGVFGISKAQLQYYAVRVAVFVRIAACRAPRFTLAKPHDVAYSTWHGFYYSCPLADLVQFRKCKCVVDAIGDPVCNPRQLLCARVKLHQNRGAVSRVPRRRPCFSDDYRLGDGCVPLLLWRDRVLRFAGSSARRPKAPRSTRIDCRH